MAVNMFLNIPAVTTDTKIQIFDDFYPDFDAVRSRDVRSSVTNLIKYHLLSFKNQT